MKNNEEDLKNKFKQALISTYKAISLDLIKSKKLNKKLKENSYNLDQFDNYNISTDFDKLRAKVDSDALKKNVIVVIKYLINTNQKIIMRKNYMKFQKK